MRCRWVNELAWGFAESAELPEELAFWAENDDAGIVGIRAQRLRLDQRRGLQACPGEFGHAPAGV